MKGFAFWLIMLSIGTATFRGLVCSSKGSTASNPGMISLGSKNALPPATKSRKLKNLQGYPSNSDEGVDLEDYRSIDPVPSSVASIRPGPVQHGAPQIPYIPKPSPPPGQAMHGGLA